MDVVPFHLVVLYGRAREVEGEGKKEVQVSRDEAVECGKKCEVVLLRAAPNHRASEAR